MFPHTFMEALARFGDSLEEMELLSPPKRTQRCKCSHRQAFPTASWLCFPNLSTGLCKERVPCLAHLSMDMCMGKTLDLQITSLS